MTALNQSAGVTDNPAPHPDDLAVDRAAAKMKAKMALSRAKGRGGWETASAEFLQSLLAGHVKKGDPVDVMNIAMMLAELGYSTAPQEQAA